MQLFTNYFIEKLRGRKPDDLILLHASRKITAAQLLEQSINLAVGLQKCGLHAGDRILLAVPPGIDFLKVIYANMMLGAMVCIIDPEMGRDNYRSKLKQFKPKFIFADSRLLLLNEHPIAKFFALLLNPFLPDISNLDNCTLITTGYKLPIFRKHFHISSLSKKSTTEISFVSTQGNLPFLVTYTSGTLFEPKGVVHTCNSLTKTIRLLSKELMNNGDVSIATHLPHFALLGISAGIRVYIWDNTAKAERKIEFIKEHNITTLFGPPSDFLPIINFLKQQNQQLPACLLNIYLGSAPVYVSFLQKLIPFAPNIKITCLYGMTEHLMVCKVDGREKVLIGGVGDLVGKPFENVIVSTNSDGELLVDSDQKFLGYLDGEEMFEPHSTGDLAMIDEKGQVLLIGRKKDMIIRGNFNIYPGLYEPTINQIPGVIESVMIGKFNQKKEDEEVYLVVESEKILDAGFIFSNLTRGEYSIDKNAIPDKVLFRTLPRSGRQNKVNRKILAQSLKSVPE